MGVLVKYLYRLVGHGSPGQVSMLVCSWESWSSICIGWSWEFWSSICIGWFGHGSSGQVSV